MIYIYVYTSIYQDVDQLHKISGKKLTSYLELYRPKLSKIGLSYLLSDTPQKMLKCDIEKNKFIFPRHYHLLPMQPSLVENCLPSLFRTLNDENEEVTRSMILNLSSVLLIRGLSSKVVGIR